MKKKRYQKPQAAAAIPAGGGRFVCGEGLTRRRGELVRGATAGMAACDGGGYCNSERERESFFFFFFGWFLFESWNRLTERRLVKFSYKNTREREREGGCTLGSIYNWGL